jgi:tripartite-type tricarboxylate transporter receptor subunit TctC
VALIDRSLEFMNGVQMNCFGKRSVKHVEILCLATMVALCLPAQAQTQAWPTKPIRLVIGFAPGGAADYVARTISEPLGRALGQSVVVENRAGAGSSLAADHVAKSAADGYTLLIASPSSISVNPSLNPKLSYSAKDLVPVTRLTSSPLVVAVNPALGINSFQELIATAKAKPGFLNYTTSGLGSAPHLGAAHFSKVAGVEMVHIPYKGGALAIQAVIAGDAQLTFGTPPSVLPMVQAGRLKAIAVTSLNRSPLVPDVPGTKEAGLPAYSLSFWYGFFVPVGTPPEIVKKLYETTQQVMQRPEVKAALAREGTEVAMSQSPADFAAFLEGDNRFWAKLVKDAGVKPE